MRILRGRSQGTWGRIVPQHYDVYEGGAGFADVLQTEVDFLHRHAKTGT